MTFDLVEPKCSTCPEKRASYCGLWDAWYCGACRARRTDCEIYYPDMTVEEIDLYVRTGEMKFPRQARRADMFFG